jgi:hypothetical protein
MANNLLKVLKQIQAVESGELRELITAIQSNDASHVVVKFSDYLKECCAENDPETAKLAIGHARSTFQTLYPPKPKKKKEQTQTTAPPPPTTPVVRVENIGAAGTPPPPALPNNN